MELATQSPATGEPSTYRALPSRLRGLRVAAPTALIIGIGHLSMACAADIEPFLLLQHTSDLLRGPPFSGRDDTTQDYIAGGVTISAGAWEIDISHGFKTIDCRYSRGCGYESGSQITARFYPRRK